MKTLSQQTTMWVTLVALLLLPLSTGYPEGAPSDACPSMIPGHDPSIPQTTPSPFAITVSATSFSPGDIIYVNITASDTQPFKGFLIQAVRVSAPDNGNVAIGNLTSPSNTTAQTVCSTDLGNGVTHVDSDSKTFVSFQWQAPSQPEENIVFKVTFVEAYDTFWVGVKSPVIRSSVTPSTPSSTTGTTPSSTSSSAAEFQKPDGCGNAYGCFYSCHETGCTLLVQWHSVAEDTLEIGLKAAVMPPADRWVAVAFSTDGKMGGDDVIQCVSSGPTITAGQSYNEGHSNQPVNDVNNTVQLISSSYKDGVLNCVVRRNIRVRGSTRNVVDLSQSWFLLLGQGPVVRGVMRRHIQTPISTAFAVDLKNHVDIGGTAPSYLLVKIHGSLMSIAWLLLASLGIILARYFKPMWPNSTIMNLKIWFQIHRACMTLTLLATITAFVIIFVSTGGYSDIVGEVYMQAHPILGIIVTALVIANPLMALFRPAPDAPNRPIFNWAHWAVGLSAYLLAVITIFFGTRLQKSAMPYFIVYILAGYVAWQVLVVACLEITEMWIKVNKAKEYELKSKVGDSINSVNTTEAPCSLVKHCILGLHLIATTAFTVVVVIFIVLGNAESS